MSTIAVICCRKPAMPNPHSGLRTFAGGVLVAILVAVCGTCIASNFVKIHSRPKWAECRSYLRFAYVAEESFRQERLSYSVRVADLGFVVERGNRYAYFFSEEAELQDRSTATLVSSSADTGVAVDTLRHGTSAAVPRSALPARFAGGLRLGMTGPCPDGALNPYATVSPTCAVTIACGAQLDTDPELDVWSVSTISRQAPSGEEIPAGEPFNEVSDTDSTEWSVWWRDLVASLRLAFTW